jgi:hypothetical protein
MQHSLHQMGLGLKELPTPKKIFNIDNTTNKSGKITHYLDLDVCAKGIHKEMCFLITDIGSKDLLLGYPWLATFEPKFNWQHTVIDKRMLPVIISSVQPTNHTTNPVIAKLMTDNEKNIHCTHIGNTIHNTGSIYRTRHPSRTKHKGSKIPPEYAPIPQTI